MGKSKTLKTIIDKAIRAAVARHKGRVTDAARELCIAHKTIYNRCPDLKYKIAIGRRPKHAKGDK